MLEEKDVAKFKALFAARFDIELDDEVARRKLVLLVKQMETIYQPIKRSDALDVNGDVETNEVKSKL